MLTALGALAVMYAAVVTWRQNERAAGFDFYIYYVNAQLAGRQDVGNIYDRDVQSRIGEEYHERALRSGSELRQFDARRRRFLDSVSSPFLYTCLSWVSRDYDRALQQYHVVVLAAFLLGYLLLARAVRLSWPAALFLLAALLLWYRGFEADLRVGNVNSLQLLMLAASLLSPSVVAGAIAGMLIAFKPNLILIPLLLAVARAASRDWRRLRLEVLGGAIGVAIAVIAAAVRYGSFNIWLQWIARAGEFYHRLPTRTERNVTPLLALFQERGAWLSYVIALLLTVIAIVAIWRGKSRDDVMIAGVAIMIYLLSATVVWLHYMVLIIPIALALMRWRVTAIVSVLALAAIAEEPFEMLTRIAVFPNDAKLLGPAFFVLFVCAVWKLANTVFRESRPSP
ncbi:MAG TPA: glycosyltransferase 87 family protein [Thermoanaerobaculia bacterium]|nr:glycosyltransferase 87 family protein [Thermoanaerobaculia bacterium]